MESNLRAFHAEEPSHTRGPLPGAACTQIPISPPCRDAPFPTGCFFTRYSDVCTSTPLPLMLDSIPLHR